jgi:hypothetical protein
MEIHLKNKSCRWTITSFAYWEFRITFRHSRKKLDVTSFSLIFFYYFTWPKPMNNPLLFGRFQAHLHSKGGIFPRRGHYVIGELLTLFTSHGEAFSWSASPYTFTWSKGSHCWLGRFWGLLWWQNRPPRLILSVPTSVQPELSSIWIYLWVIILRNVPLGNVLWHTLETLWWNGFIYR